MNRDQSFGTISIPIDYAPTKPSTPWLGLIQIVCPHFAFKSLSLLFIALNIFIYFLLLIISASADVRYNCLMYYVGASFPPAYMRLQVHRLVVSAFLHFGLSHLWHNCLASFVLSFEPEYVLGIKRFLILYALTASYGIMLTSVVHPNAIAAGASTSIMGLYGYRLVRIVVRAKQMNKGSYPFVLLLLVASTILVVTIGKWNIYTLCALVVASVINFTLIDKTSIALRVVTAVVRSYFDFGFFLAFIASKGDAYGHAGGLVAGILYSVTQLDDDTEGFGSLALLKKWVGRVMIAYPIGCVIGFLIRGVKYRAFC
eukprot:TRINITY_DN14711_c0_g1_i1.p1 TRINITY_DN14711_c0_g1~~TRINITY_DN14711_c0_g1_i1.p1  ORF type:complete len:314 (+),score=35.66 TRINITY_DN14711_c0_g1_i1:154-1095(+)